MDVLRNRDGQLHTFRHDGGGRDRNNHNNGDGSSDPRTNQQYSNREFLHRGPGVGE
jgi:hypothetical protein